MEAVPVGTGRYFDTAWQIWIYLTPRARALSSFRFVSIIIIDSRLQKRAIWIVLTGYSCQIAAIALPSKIKGYQREWRKDAWAWRPINIDLKWLMRICFFVAFAFAFAIVLSTHNVIRNDSLTFSDTHSHIHTCAVHVCVCMVYNMTLKSAWFGSWCHLPFLLVLFCIPCK